MVSKIYSESKSTGKVQDGQDKARKEKEAMLIEQRHRSKIKYEEAFLFSTLNLWQFKQGVTCIFHLHSRNRSILFKSMQFSYSS